MTHSVSGRVLPEEPESVHIVVTRAAVTVESSVGTHFYVPVCAEYPTQAAALERVRQTFPQLPVRYL